MPRSKKTSSNSDNTTPIEHLKHDDQRVNIPTEELRGFVTAEQPPMMRYPRDPSLDPQLVWKGKDEQDGQDLEVPTVPLYIQEHIHPHALIEEFRRELEGHEPEPNAAQLDLFATTFEGGLDFDARVDFYNHASDWSNRMILGDSLLVMNSLAEKEDLRGKVQCIYIDPPYGIKFGSNWQVSIQETNVKDGVINDVTHQPEQIRAFRDTWELGIHSYLSYLRDRLMVARELLTESGSCFVQIGDDNVHLVRCLMDEVFGGENFISTIVFQKTGNQKGSTLEPVCDYILFFAKNVKLMKFKPVFIKKHANEESANPLTSGGVFRTQVFDFLINGKRFCPPLNNSWKTSFSGMNRLKMADRILPKKTSLRYKSLMSDFGYSPQTNIWLDSMGSREKIYVVQTNEKIVKRCILMTTDPGDIVLDPTDGSGTTAYVAEQWGRRWIAIDTSRVALALARTRLMTAKYPYYLLKDSPEGLAKIADLTGQPVSTNKTKNDIKQGFVYRTVPHITLKSIANNEEIDTIHEKWQAKLEPCRDELNRTLGQNWQEWEIPREPAENWPAATKKQHAQWWELRRKRQQEIDDSIARRAEQETLYDQPYEDKKRLRVTGLHG